MKVTTKRICIYAFLFFFIMVIDQRILTSWNYARCAFRQASALPFLAIIVMQMDKEKLKNMAYRIYGVISVVVAIVGGIYLWKTQEFYLQYSVLWIEILIVGFILLYLIRTKKLYVEVKKIFTWTSIFWIVTLGLMGISRYEGFWPWEFLLVFLLLIFVEIDKEEQKLIFKGMLYGIMTSYFAIQGAALLFRPYDVDRYQGAFNNTNMNALFYVVVFAAFLVNQYMLVEEDRETKFKVLNTFFMMSVFGFTILTVGKAAMLTEIIVMILYLFFMILKNEKKVKFLLATLLSWLVLTVCLVPICFLSARYMPTIINHPVWFYGEYSEERVHSYDPYDSEKYPETEDIYEKILDRFLGISDESAEEKEEVISQAVAGDGSDPLHPLYVGDDAKTSYSARIGIWKEYFKRINLSGHRIDEMHFWLTENFYVYHAHNVFLEFAYNFGVIAGLLFFLGYLFFGIKQLIKTWKSKSWLDFHILVFLSILGVFGLVELNWFVGQAPLVLFFFMICNMIWNEKRVNNLLK